jgi:Fe-S cluster assembly ATPase SufC
MVHEPLVDLLMRMKAKNASGEWWLEPGIPPVFVGSGFSGVNRKRAEILATSAHHLDDRLLDIHDPHDKGWGERQLIKGRGRAF